MNDWRRIESIFGEALELAPEARQAFLDRACSGDPALRAEVDSLLGADADASPTFLDQPVDDPVDLLGDAPEPPGAGDRVGAYRLVKKLGEGGMGTVYLAERDDGAFEREVAVKVLRAGLWDEHARRRFDVERRILATLDHPGIARLLDGGTTPTGAPFVVMERVDGEPIDRYCRRLGLSADARVDLVVEVCDAVAAAHRSLVVHRDIKPSNVLVDVDGRPKLLDFGIAKILDPERAEALGADGNTTVGWRRALTPNYASPEQLCGEPITVGTDVYLLGIVLYKLLTGEVPHRLQGRRPSEAEDILTRHRPEPPSRRRRASDGDPWPPLDIDPDLDLITLKALRRDPVDRYPSVEALAADLRRLRGGLPIEARIGNRRYRLRKFAGRHRRALAAAAAAVLMLTLFAADRAVQVERRQEALQRAEASLARSESLRGFVEGLFWEADPAAAKGSPLTVTEALDRGEAKLERSSDALPSVRAAMHALVGRIRYDLGQVDKAVEHLEHALELYGDAGATTPADRIAVLRAQGALGLALFHGLGAVEVDDRGAALEQALESARTAYRDSRYLVAIDPGLAFELSDPLAELYCRLDRYDEAAPLTAEALHLLELAGEPRTTAAAAAIARRALVLKNRQQDLGGARLLYGQALELFRELEGPTFPEVANTLNQLGLVAEALGDGDDARALHTEALAVRRQLYGEVHREVGQSLFHLSLLALRADDVTTAIGHFEELVGILTALYGDTDGRTVERHLLFAEALIAADRAAEAEAILRIQLDDVHRAARPAGSRLIVWAEGMLGVALLDQGQDRGRPLLETSIESLRAKPRHYEERLDWLEKQARRLVA
ncbi:MAG: serine/threonine-protein kinase [Acidobacteriota bacterium]